MGTLLNTELQVPSYLRRRPPRPASHRKGSHASLWTHGNIGHNASSRASHHGSHGPDSDTKNFTSSVVSDNNRFVKKKENKQKKP